MARHKVIRSPRLVRKTRKRAVRKVALWSFLSVFLAGAFIYTLLQPEFRIQRIETDGSDTVEKGRIIEFIKAGLRGTYLGFIPREHILFYPRRSLEEEVR